MRWRAARRRPIDGSLRPLPALSATSRSWSRGRLRALPATSSPPAQVFHGLQRARPRIEADEVPNTQLKAHKIRRVEEESSLHLPAASRGVRGYSVVEGLAVHALRNVEVIRVAIRRFFAISQSYPRNPSTGV